MAAKFSPPFSVLVSHNPPLTFIDVNKTGSARYSGLLVDLLPQLFQASGIATDQSTFRFYETTFRANAGSLVNGSWTSGTIKELLAGRAFLSVAPHTETMQRTPYMEVVPVSNEGFAMLVRTQVTTNGQKSFIEPFTPNLWLLLLCTVLAMALVLYAVDFVTTKLHVMRAASASRWRHAQRTRRRSMDCLATGTVSARSMDPGLSRESSFAQSEVDECERSSLGRSRGSMNSREVSDDPAMSDRGGQHFLEVWLTITQNCKIPRQRSQALQQLYVGLSLFFLLVTAAYSAQLTSILTISRSQPEIASLAELRASKRPFCTIANSAIGQYFQQGTDVYALDMVSHMVVGASQDDCVAALRNGTVDAFLQHYILAAYYLTLQPCDLSLVDIGFKASNLGLCLAAGNPIIPVLNAAILKLREDGVVTALTTRWANTLSQCSNSIGSSINANTMALDQVYILFLCLAAGLGLAMLLLLSKQALAAAGRTAPVAAVTGAVSDKLSKSFTRVVGVRAASVLHMNNDSHEHEHSPTHVTERAVSEQHHA